MDESSASRQYVEMINLEHESRGVIHFLSTNRGLAQAPEKASIMGQAA